MKCWYLVDMDWVVGSVIVKCVIRRNFMMSEGMGILVRCGMEICRR